MIEPLEIKYRDFYDFPRMFVIGFGDGLLLFDGSFRDDLDDYPASYEVYVLPRLGESELEGSWSSLASKASLHVGHVPTDQVHFDSTRRLFVDGAAVRRLLPLAAA